MRKICTVMLSNPPRSFANWISLLQACDAGLLEAPQHFLVAHKTMQSVAADQQDVVFLQRHRPSPEIRRNGDPCPRRSENIFLRMDFRLVRRDCALTK